MVKDLIDFYKNVEILNKDYGRYTDEEGNLQILPLPYLICSVEFQKVDEKAKKVLIYNKELDSKLELKKDRITIQVDKSTETKKEKDFGTIIDKEIDVELIWKVSNGLKLSKIFNDKDEALKFVGEMNDRFIKAIESK